MPKSIATLFLALLLSASAAAQTDDPSAGATTIDHIVAVVNDDVVLKSELDNALDQIRRQFAGRANLPPQDVLERQLLERLIMIKLQLQSAEQNNVRVSENDVDQALESMAQRNDTTVSQMREALARDGLGFADFRESIREQLVIERMTERVIERRLDVSESEVDIQLERQQPDDREYHLATILIGVPDGASPELVQQARERAEQLRQELRQGRDFEQAAMALSDAQNALQGGDMGWRRAEQMPPQFAELMRRMSPGDVSPPVRAAGGFWLLQLKDDRPAQALMVTEHHARHILAAPTELVSDQQAYQKIVDLRRRIVQEGEDFGRVAREHSDDIVTGAKGGDMGWFGPNAYGTRIDQIVAGLEPGEISQPFRTGGGWHVLQLLDTRQVDRTEDQRRARAREAIRERKREEETETWLQQLRAEAYVDVRLPG